MEDNFTQTPVMDEPWERIRAALELGDTELIRQLLEEIGTTETSLVLSRLNEYEQGLLMTLLQPSEAASIIEEVHEAQAADIIESLAPEHAAAIVDEMQSDVQADLLSEMKKDSADAILEEMPPSEAEETRAMLSYPPDSAGGLMITEYLAYRQGATVSEVRSDLREKGDIYSDYPVKYIYVVDDGGRLTGVAWMKDLVFSPAHTLLERIMISTPKRVRENCDLDELREFFRENRFYGVPVTDNDEVLIGVVLSEAVEKALEKKAVKQFLWFSGIVGGEEFRSMPLIKRSGRRLSWLTINIVLNIMAASVIAFYQDTLEAVIALAIFLPMISDMSGCSGNQAIAVSMRELTLGLIRPVELARVLRKELALGVINGLALGTLLGVLALLWKGNPWLGIVVGGALMVNTIVAVSIGGMLPLALKRLRMDPALVASPLLTTVTDMCGFFFVLGFASLMLNRL